ncbi:alpha/beta fold hydrolase [Pseudoalteromonas luteoviolacea]|uniref:alpha/beta fold hydrolase n=1 Tax=Pseudoalteromonas luteoviolacea TaxID=43657 RepID=UPI003AF32A7C
MSYIQNDVLTILSFLKISQFSLFGFSDGGIVAYRIAVQYPEKVSRLITLGSQWRLEPGDPINRGAKRLNCRVLVGEVCR